MSKPLDFSARRTPTRAKGLERTGALLRRVPALPWTGTAAAAKRFTPAGTAGRVGGLERQAAAGGGATG